MKVLRPLVPLVVLAVLLARVGWQPFVVGLRAVSVPAVLAALLLSAVATVCCAWRWQSVAGRLDQGVVLPLRQAVAMYYRAQLLNVTLPLGVAGDLHRGVSHGRRAGGPWRGLRSVLTERLLGQGVAVAVTLAALLLVPTPLLHAPSAVRLPLAGLLLVAAALGCARWPRVVLTSVAVALAQATVFLVALHATSRHLDALAALPLALVVLLVGAVPLNLAGWGPREGAAAWVFALAGPGARVGVEASVAFGVLCLLAALPGLLVLARPQVVAGA